MIRPPPRSTRTATLLPDTTLFPSLPPADRSVAMRRTWLHDDESDRVNEAPRFRHSGAEPVVEFLAVALDLDRHAAAVLQVIDTQRSEEHTSELQSLMRISYAVFCLQKKIKKQEQLHIARKLT